MRVWVEWPASLVLKTLLTGSSAPHPHSSSVRLWPLSEIHASPLGCKPVSRTVLLIVSTCLAVNHSLVFTQLRSLVVVQPCHLITTSSSSVVISFSFYSDSCIKHLCIHSYWFSTLHQSLLLYLQRALITLDRFIPFTIRGDNTTTAPHTRHLLTLSRRMAIRTTQHNAWLSP